ncbi:MAG: hypothetical protein AAFU73_23600 [Planctomycetota bacterium]
MGPAPKDTPACAECGRVQRRAGTHCEMCGALLGGVEAPGAPTPRASIPLPPAHAPAAGTAGLPEAPEFRRPAPPPARSYGELPPEPRAEDRPLPVLPLERPAPGRRAPIPPPPAPEPAPAHFGLGEPILERRSRNAVQFLLLGVPLAAAFTLTPLVRFMGWFIASLVHELGHTLAGWFMGCPSWPAISLSGEAMARHGEPLWAVRIAILALCVYGIRQVLAGGAQIAAFAGLALVYAALIFTPLGEMLFLASGQGLEVVGACVCLWRAATAEACKHDAERAAYAMVGWFLAGRNLWLSFGLAFSESARAEYAGNGSFGLTNDYIRLAGELGTSLGFVGLATGVLSVVAVAVTVPLALRATRV